MPTFTPLLGAEILLDPHTTTTLPVDPAFEHGLLVDQGDITLVGTLLGPSDLGYLPPGPDTLTLTNDTGAPARAVLLGGPPFGEEIVMWWKFVGRSHEDIAEARRAWQDASDRFGSVEGYADDRLPAPALPNAVLAPRKNPDQS